MVGRGGAIQPHCLISTNTTLGDYVHLVANCAIGNDCQIGGYTTCYPGCHISGGVTLGEGVLLGTGTVVNDNVRVAAGVSTGSQTCIIKDIDEPNIQVVGVPARKISRIAPSNPLPIGGNRAIFRRCGTRKPPGSGRSGAGSLFSLDARVQRARGPADGFHANK